MADAFVFILEKCNFSYCYSTPVIYVDIDGMFEEIANTYIIIGTGNDISVADSANLIKAMIGYMGGFLLNTLKPNGTLKKLADVSKLRTVGWKHSVVVEEGIEKMYNWYLNE